MDLTGRGQLPGILRKSPRCSIDQDKPVERPLRRPSPACTSFQGPLDPIYHLCLPPILDHPSSRPWVAELGNYRIWRGFWRARIVRTPFQRFISSGADPCRIYLVRTGASRFFEYRIAKTQQHLDGLEKQRGEKIEKLKAATKYNSTQQLLEKYGGESPRPSPSKGEEKRAPEPMRKPSTPQQPVARTGLVPPPTANIRRPPFSDAPAPAPAPPSTPPSSNNMPPPPYGMQGPPQNFPHPPSPQQPIKEPGFAPNAFRRSSQYIEQSHWYDRLLDVLLGEDETQPKNRVALLCSTCRLVNGQAPPGIKTLEELGHWRCGGCGAWNGEDSETTKVLADIREKSQKPQPVGGAWEPVSKTDTDNQSSGGDGTDEAVMVATSDDGSSGVETPDEGDEGPEPNKKSSRGRSKGGKRKG